MLGTGRYASVDGGQASVFGGTDTETSSQSSIFGGTDTENGGGHAVFQALTPAVAWQDWLSWALLAPTVSILFSAVMYYTYGVPAGVLSLLFCGAIDAFTLFYNW